MRRTPQPRAPAPRPGRPGAGPAIPSAPRSAGVRQPWPDPGAPGPVHLNIRGAPARGLSGCTGSPTRPVPPGRLCLPPFRFTHSAWPPSPSALWLLPSSPGAPCTPFILLRIAQGTPFPPRSPPPLPAHLSEPDCVVHPVAAPTPSTTPFGVPPAPTLAPSGGPFCEVRGRPVFRGSSSVFPRACVGIESTLGTGGAVGSRVQCAPHGSVPLPWNSSSGKSPACGTPGVLLARGCPSTPAAAGSQLSPLCEITDLIPKFHLLRV